MFEVAEIILKKTGIKIPYTNHADNLRSITIIIKEWLDEESCLLIMNRYYDKMSFAQIGNMRGISSAQAKRKIEKILEVFKQPAAVYYIANGFWCANNSVEERITMWKNACFEDFQKCTNIKFYHTKFYDVIDKLMRDYNHRDRPLVRYKKTSCGTQSIEDLLTEVSVNLMTYGTIGQPQRNKSKKEQQKNKQIFAELQKLGLIYGSLDNPVLLLPDMWEKKLNKLGRKQNE